MRETTVILPQTARDEIRRDVQLSIRDAVREARDAAREAGLAGREAADAARQPFAFALGSGLDVATTISLYEAQIAAMNKEITELTGQLTPGQSQAREQAVRQQLGDAVSRREDLREQMDLLLAGGTPVVAQPQLLPGEMIPPQVVTMSIAFFVMCAVVAVGIPVARAWGRWLDRRGHTPPGASSQTDDRLNRIEQAIEAVAIEVERVSEGQRYTNRNISELRGLPAPNAGQGWPLPAREAVGVDRRSEG
jgi:hypothetical protein